MEATNPDLFNKWKSQAKYSDDYKLRQTQKAEDQKLEDAQNKFYGTTDIDNQVKAAEIQSNIEKNSVFNLKNQFLLESNQSDKPKHHFNDNLDFMTTNTFYHELTKNSEHEPAGMFSVR